MIAIRPTEGKDKPAILELTRAAFTKDGEDGRKETEIVEDTWAAGASAMGMDLVAIDGERVVGHVLGAFGDLDGQPLLAVAPLSVTPDRQGEGIGTALMNELLRRAQDRGLPAVVLLGSAEYYRRFGFEPAGRLGIVYPPVGPDSPHFMVRRLDAYDPGLRGVFRFRWEAS